MRALLLEERAWIDEVRAAVAPIVAAHRVRLVPRGDDFELVVSTAGSPPHWTTVKSLTDALFWLVSRENSPVAKEEGDDVRSGTFHFDPPPDPRSEGLFRTLEWSEAITIKDSA